MSWDSFIKCLKQLLAEWEWGYEVAPHHFVKTPHNPRPADAIRPDPTLRPPDPPKLLK